MLKIKIFTLLFLIILIPHSFAKTVEFNLRDISFEHNNISINALYILEDYSLSIGPFYKNYGQYLGYQSEVHFTEISNIGIRFENSSYVLGKGFAYFAIQAYQESFKAEQCPATTRLRSDFLAGYGYRFNNSFSIKFGIGMGAGEYLNELYDCEAYEAINDSKLFINRFFVNFTNMDRSFEFDASLGFSF